jgi:hypothetical protein
MLPKLSRPQVIMLGVSALGIVAVAMLLTRRKRAPATTVYTSYVVTPTFISPDPLKPVWFPEPEMSIMDEPVSVTQPNPVSQFDFAHVISQWPQMMAAYSPLLPVVDAARSISNAPRAILTQPPYHPYRTIH